MNLKTTLASLFLAFCGVAIFKKPWEYLIYYTIACIFIWAFIEAVNKTKRS